VKADGTIDYTPNANFNGTDSFTYTPNDGKTDGAPVTVTVTVTAVVDLPVANDDSSANPAVPSVNNPTTLVTISLNDTDPDGSINPSTVDLDPSTPEQETTLTTNDGKWVVDSNSTVVFTPNATLTGSPSPIWYTIKDDNGNTSNKAKLSVSYLAQAPDISLVKTTGSVPVNAGDTLLYIFTVVNTGNVPMTSVTLNDIKCAASPVLKSETGSIANTLEVDETQVYSCTSVAVTQEEVAAGKVVNSASVTATSASGVTLPPVEDTVETSIAYSPAIAIIKGSSVSLGNDDILNAGDVVTYSYEVSNTGNIVLNNVVVTETAADFSGTGALPVPVWVSNSGSSPQGVLAPGEIATFTASYALTQDDINAGQLNNRAVGTGTPPNAPDGTPATAVTDESDSSNPNDPNETGQPGKPGEKDPTGTPLTAVPAISTSKGSSLEVGEDGILTTGDIVTYHYNVKNIGNVVLTNVNVTETQADFSGTGILPEPVWQANDGASPAGILVPGETASYTADYVLTAEDIASGLLNNRAVGTGTPPDKPNGDPGTPVTDESDSSNPNDPNETGTPAQPAEKDKTGTPLAPPGIAAGIVYEDSNANGTQDAGEPGIAGVTVTVTDVSGKRHSLTTDENGNYAVKVPPGDVIIDIDDATLPQGFIQTEGTDITTLTVPSGGVSNDVDGYKPPVSGNIRIIKTVYGDDDPAIGHDNGAGCGTTRATSRAILVDLDKSKNIPVTYCFEVINSGETYLDNIVITDETLGIQHTQLTLLNGPVPESLEPGASLMYYYQVLATESLTNTASVAAVASDSQGNPTGATVEPEGTSTAELVLIIDPPKATKTVNSEGVTGMKWDMVWINDSEIAAPGVTVFDEIPFGTRFQPIPAGNFVSASGVYCETRGASTTSNAFDDNCYFEQPSAMYPRGRVIWKGTVAADPGLHTEDTAQNEVVIRFISVMENPGLPNQLFENQADSAWDFDNDGNSDLMVPTDNPATPEGEPDKTEFKPASNIPTLSEWMLIMLSLLLFVIGKRENLKLLGQKY
jgi:hypothetical protein